MAALSEAGVLVEAGMGVCPRWLREREVGQSWVSSSSPLLRVPDRAALLEEEGLLLAGGDEAILWRW